MKTNEERLNELLAHLDSLDHIHVDEIPQIDLYMDQVTTFMEKHLGELKRYPEDKVLTKTMINNYAKNNLLPSPVKKKYTQEHILLLVFIYYFKNILSIKDIETLLAPVTEENFNNGEDFSLTDIYKEICQHEKSRTSYLAKDIAHSFKAASETFSNAPEEDRRSLQQFSFICSLAFDVYVKKQLIEKLIDEMPEPEHKKKKK